MNTCFCRFWLLSVLCAHVSLKFNDWTKMCRCVLNCGLMQVGTVWCIALMSWALHQSWTSLDWNKYFTIPHPDHCKWVSCTHITKVHDSGRLSQENTIKMPPLRGLASLIYMSYLLTPLARPYHCLLTLTLRHLSQTNIGANSPPSCHCHCHCHFQEAAPQQKNPSCPLSFLGLIALWLPRSHKGGWFWWEEGVR